jgi:hypothetical protein
LGRYKRFKHWLPEETIAASVDLAGKIVGTLTNTIKTLKANRGVGGDNTAYEV